MYYLQNISSRQLRHSLYGSINFLLDQQPSFLVTLHRRQRRLGLYIGTKLLILEYHLYKVVLRYQCFIPFSHIFADYSIYNSITQNPLQINRKESSMNLAQHPEIVRFLRQLSSTENSTEPLPQLPCPICGQLVEPCQSSTDSISVCCSHCYFHASVPRNTKI